MPGVACALYTSSCFYLILFQGIRISNQTLKHELLNYIQDANNKKISNYQLIASAGWESVRAHGTGRRHRVNSVERIRVRADGLLTRGFFNVYDHR